MLDDGRLMLAGDQINVGWQGGGSNVGMETEDRLVLIATLTPIWLSPLL